jgi:hypothetical protein
VNDYTRVYWLHIPPEIAEYELTIQISEQ